MPLDPQVNELIEETLALNLPPYNEISPAEARRQMLMASPPVVPNHSAARVEDRRIPGPGGEIPIRLYYPSGSGPFAAVVFFHGGGWVIGSIETHDAYCHALAKLSHCLVASVEYRLAPEHRYPAAAEDAYAATFWLSENAGGIQVDPRRIAVCGDSAGGNLAAVTSLMARDRGDPEIAFQVLIYPVTDFNFDTASYRNNGDGYLLTRDLMIWFWRHYIEDEETARQPYASPLRAEDLRGLPGALVLTAEFDPLLDEGEEYARRLETAGVPVILRRYEGLIHGFSRQWIRLDQSRKALEEVAATLRQKLIEKG